MSVLSSSYALGSNSLAVKLGGRTLTSVRTVPAVRLPSAKPRAVAAVAAEAAPASVPAKKTKGSKKRAPSQRLLLRFVWLEKNIGIAVDQLIPGQGTVPMSSYMFWPRKDAWEELKEFLESKPWVSERTTILLLNQATDIINLWQETTFKP